MANKDNLNEKVMKKIIFLFVLSLVLGISSCSHDEEMLSPAPKHQGVANKSATIQKLQEVNDSISNNIESVRESRGFFRGITLLSADAVGAYQLGKIGGIVGGALGSAAAGVGAAPGAAAGALGGALIGGIGASYAAYCTTKGGCHTSTQLPPGFTLKDMIDKHTEACSITGNGSSGSASSNVLYMPDSLEWVGRCHNLVMDVLLDNYSSVMPLGNDLDVPVGPEVSDCTLSEFQLQVLETNEYTGGFNETMSTVLAGESLAITYDHGLMDEVMATYLEAIGYYDLSDYYDEIVALTNQYIDIVRASDELTNEEKTQLYIAFAVAVYSYQYWSINFQED